MRIDIMTLFPDMCETVLSESIIGRARKKGLLTINCHDIREYSLDKHRHVDDAPYGGGTGMIMQPGPIYDCFSAVCAQAGARPHLVYMSPAGKTFTQKDAVRLSRYDNLTLLCGHYEGVDQRVIDEIVDEEISVGDFVVTGGELPALLVADSVARMLPGVLKCEESYVNESHFSGLLEYPQYTRPPVFLGREVPDVLQNGYHAHILNWQREESLKRTLERRPDMLGTADLSDKDRNYLDALVRDRKSKA